MARFAPVGPTALHKEMFIQQGVADYNLWLAHEVIEQPDVYKAIRNRHDNDEYVILDNSLIELGHAMEGSDLIQAVLICKPSFVVIPDTLYDSAASVVQAEEFIKIMAPHVGQDCGGYVIVAQGGSLQAAMEMVYDVRKMIGTSQFMISVPRAVANRDGSREPLVEAICLEYGEDDQFDGIHMLGFSNFPEDDFTVASSYSKVIGIDSSVPLRLGWEEVSLLPFVEQNMIPEFKRERYEFFAEATELNTHMMFNVGYAQGRLNRG